MFEPIAPNFSSDKELLLPESLRIDRSGKVLSWVDIERGTLSRCDLESGAISTIFVAPNLSFAHPLSEGSLIVAAGSRLGLLSRTNELSQSGPLIGDMRRFNDGFVDVFGRIVVGAKNLGETDGRNPLLVINSDRHAVVLDHDLGLSNGIACHPETGALYSVDSEHSIVFMRSVDSHGGFSSRTIFHHFSEGETPDGITFSTDGDLYVALWGSGCVVRLGSDGKQIERLVVPSPFVTSVALHPLTGDMFVATASEEREGQSGHAAGQVWRAAHRTPGLPLNEWNPINLNEVEPYDADR